jgi:hypothetical protein
MGIREKVNQNSGIAIGAACAVILLAIGFIVMQTRGGAAGGGAAGMVFFTTDDGKTWFADDPKNIAPFQKDGKEAVRAYVFRAGDGTEFVGYLERYTPAGKKSLEAALVRPPEEQIDDPFLAVAGAVQWKKPGDKEWVGANDPKAGSVTKVVSPKGESDTVTHVAPGQ